MPDEIYHFPPEITLLKYPLAEAWLELQWEVEGDEQGIYKNFLLNLSSFYNLISEDFPASVQLPGAQLPLEAGPIVRTRFTPGPDQWPLIQFGPGVASLNFSPDGYSWNAFKGRALFLREKLIQALGKVPIKLTNIILRYRNRVDFNHSQENVSDFIREHLNVTVGLPQHFPGRVVVSNAPIDQRVHLSYRLLVPPSIGTLFISTGTYKDAKEMVLWQFEIASIEQPIIDIYDAAAYEQWLDMAHATIHEWFFALIDGPTRTAYERA